MAEADDAAAAEAGTTDEGQGAPHRDASGLSALHLQMVIDPAAETCLEALPQEALLVCHQGAVCHLLPACREP